MNRTSHSVKLWVAVLSVLAAGCSGDGPKLEASGVGATTTTTPALGHALTPEETAGSGPVSAFNPFADPVANIPGGREVIANPTKADIMAPASSLPEMSFGNPDAPVTLIEYASPSCPFCKRFHETVFPGFKRDYIDTGKVRYIIREFPIGHTSGQAVVALRCIAPEKYLDLLGRLFAEQQAWVSQEVRIDAIAAVAAKSGLKRAAYDACREDAALVESLKQIKDRGRKLGIIGTPNFFLEDKLFKKALGDQDLREALDAALAQHTAAAGSPQPAQ